MTLHLPSRSSTDSRPAFDCDQFTNSDCACSSRFLARSTIWPARRPRLAFSAFSVVGSFMLSSAIARYPERKFFFKTAEVQNCSRLLAGQASIRDNLPVFRVMHWQMVVLLVHSGSEEEAVYLHLESCDARLIRPLYVGRPAAVLLVT